jgi:hypothetical protein
MKLFSAIARWLWLATIALAPGTVAAVGDHCVSCNVEITGSIYVGTDQITGNKVMVCSNCLLLPRCFLCGVPVKNNPTTLPDGRILCARDAKSVVLDANETRRICSQINDDLNRTFARFAVFPANVDVDVIDRIDSFSLFHQTGFDFESPNLLGCIRPVNGGKRYWMQLMTGQTPSGLKATCAHEFAHGWCGDNVPPERRARIARDAEEGFCEMTAWLLMDGQHEEEQKNLILRNHYTRGQVYLFIEAEQRYGLDQILDWMKYGNTVRLEPGKLEAIRDVTVTAAKPAPALPRMAKTNSPSAMNTPTNSPPAAPTVAGEGFRLEGISWGAKPLAIINGHTFALDETAKVKCGSTSMVIRCVSIGKFSARIRETESGTEYELRLP